MNKMSQKEIKQVLDKLTQASDPGKSLDGTRIHLCYGTFNQRTPEQSRDAIRAHDLGLPCNRYTGRVDRIWKSISSDTIMTMFVELERDRKWRSFNLNKGVVYSIVILGDK
jgi:hypothetical protein